MSAQIRSTKVVQLRDPMMKMGASSQAFAVSPDGAAETHR